jgi:hypothetical protein
LKPLLSTIFTNPQLALELDSNQWDYLIRQARNGNVLARLGYILEEARLFGQIPIKPFLHIRSAQIYFERFYISLQREIVIINGVLKSINVPLVLLKGSAYVVQNDTAAKGRIFSDVDILVPEEKLYEVEIALLKEGWFCNTLDPYDNKYYRKWMHEIPPLRHLKRQTSIDVHHNILPKIARFCPDAKQLMANIVKNREHDLWVLSREDRVLHSAIHLFHEGDFKYGFRDLSDLDLLLKEFSQQEGFWEKLLQRAKVLRQGMPLYYALRYTHLILKTPIPNKILQLSASQACNKLNIRLMDSLFLRALLPDHKSCNDRWTGLARWVLFVRSHWLKMPLYLMIPHLFRKTFKRMFSKDQ